MTPIEATRANIYRTVLGLLIALAATGAANADNADVLRFACTGKESIYTETFEEHQENLKHRRTTVRIEIDRRRNTMTISGTTKANGTGALRTEAASYDTTYKMTSMVIYEVPFKHVLVHLPRLNNEVSIIAGTHPDLRLPDAEGRLLFSGICRATLREE